METRSNHVLVGAVVLILLAVLALFTVWLARVNTTSEKEYDIFFKQAVDGLNKGSEVAFSGVPAGQVREIGLFKPDPSLVRVRIAVNSDVPILQGTTATIQGVGFTGVSRIQLDGAVKDAPPIVCPDANPRSVCPLGVPVIPTKQGGLGALLNSAPRLLERLSTLTERLTELLSDRNQASISGILANTERLTGELAKGAPDMRATLAELRTTVAKAGVAAEQIGNLAGTTDRVLGDEVGPAMKDFRKAIESADKSMKALERTLGKADGGIDEVTTRTLPEINQLIQDLRQMTAALASVAEKIDREGAGSLIGSPKLPDYDPKKK
ncbi:MULTISPECIES: MlaD family protein [unclassified Sphingomonas]|uniref:MlaD family protein n=1 Tax=unclassified Sphingomonas TaxID=196159 RepID=UPI002150CF40|nr:MULTISPECIES: MlaD family protein [unclassified Sphingomonas]MCR5870645.1 MlaD family protein [Sphingomonas sp. J344]UUY01015.1 MlaD family protein [Sphingomonas sp. J315]